MVLQFCKLMGKLLEVSAQIAGINWPISFCLQLENIFSLGKVALNQKRGLKF